MKIAAEFVRSAARLEDFPRDRLREIALVGRSNVGKSSLINAVTRSRVARTSAAPGKTRLANVYRVARGLTAFYLVDLPGYGYARGPRETTAAFEELAQTYFARAAELEGGEHSGQKRRIAALLLVDSRHPGLDSDRAAWNWLQTMAADGRIVATKVDKLRRGERIRALRELTSVFGDSVLPFSAATGEGLDELWKLIDRLANSPNHHKRSSRPHEGEPLRRKKNR
jgi:GTP-binding protein